MRKSLLLLLLTGCPNNATPQDASPQDIGNKDATADAGFPDAAPTDAEPVDAEPEDAEPMDAADPCGPIPRADAPAAFSLSVARFVSRCLPELAPLEATAVGGLAGTSLAAVLEDVALVYDELSAGLCACDIAALPCTAPDPFASLATCRGVITGTIALGDPCTGLRCARDLSCWHDFDRANPLCGGECVAFVNPGESCDAPFGDPLPCVAGHYCQNDGKSGLTCEPLALIGEDCANRPCLGEYQPFLFATAGCDYTLEPPTCVPRGRMGDSCSNVPCHEFYVCNSTSACQLKPGAGDPCRLSADTATPTYPEVFNNLLEAPNVCRINPYNAIPSTGCVQTGSTSGQGTCLGLPGPTEACGIGRDLSARCEAGSHCPGIDPINLAPVTAACESTIPVGDECNDNWPEFLLGPQCNAVDCDYGDPTVCSNDAEGLGFCTDD